MVCSPQLVVPLQLDASCYLVRVGILRQELAWCLVVTVGRLGEGDPACKGRAGVTGGLEDGQVGSEGFREICLYVGLALGRDRTLEAPFPGVC